MPDRDRDETGRGRRSVGDLPAQFVSTAYHGARRVERELRRAGVPLPQLHRFRHRSPVGAPPGTLVSHPDAAPPVLRAFGYGPDSFEELEVESLDEVTALRARWPVLWLNVDGVGDAESVAAIGELFGLHRLALEDVMNVHQRSKVEEYASYLFTVVRSAVHGERLETEQLGFFLGDGWVITFQERAGDSWEGVRERLRTGRGRLRSQGPDYLFYNLLDASIDGFYPVLEALGHRLEELEEQVIERPRQELVGLIHAVRRDIMALRHTVWPLREAVGRLYREDHAQVQEETRVYLRDAYDHTVQVIDLLENYREMGSALLEVYLSSVGYRTNQVMKVLTIIATIFIPLTFIAGVYGMNFDPEVSPWNMPELGWYWGYPAVMLFMLLVSLGLLSLFRWKRWI